MDVLHGGALLSVVQYGLMSFCCAWVQNQDICDNSDLVVNKVAQHSKELTP